MTGTFQGFELTFGSFGHQYTAIDGERFITWFDLREPQLKGLEAGCRVEYEARPGPTVLCDSPLVEEGALLRMTPRQMACLTFLR